MKAKKIVTALAATALILTGCGNKTSDASDEIVTSISEPVEITFWHAMNGSQEEALTKLTKDFMEANPNITVTLQNQSSYGDLQQKLTATMQSPNNLPTITQAYPGWVYTAIQDGMLVDLKPYIENADKNLAFDNYADILEGLREGVEVDGKVYGLPFNKSTEVIFYNKTLFEELNLEVPTTLEELASVSKTIYEKKGIPGVGFDSLSNYYVTYLENKGIKLDSNLDPTSDASIEAAQYYLDGIKEGYFRIAGTDSYLSGPFANEQVAMYIGSNAGESFVKQGTEGKFEYGVAAYPSETVIQQGTDIYMFNAASAEQKTAAYLYMKYLTSTDSQIYWAIQSGYMPVRESAVTSDEYKNSGSSIAPVLAEITNKKLYTMPNVAGSTQALNDVKATMEAILSKKDSNVKDAMEDLKTTLSSTWE